MHISLCFLTRVYLHFKNWIVVMKLLINQLKRISLVVDVTTAWGARIYGTQVCFVMLVDSGQLMPSLLSLSSLLCAASTQQGWPARESSCDPWLRYQIWSKDSTSMAWLCCSLNSMAIYLNMILRRRAPSKKRHNRQFIISMRGIWSYCLLKALGETRIVRGEELMWYDHELRPPRCTLAMS